MCSPSDQSALDEELSTLFVPQNVFILVILFQTGQTGGRDEKKRSTECTKFKLIIAKIPYNSL